MIIEHVLFNMSHLKYVSFQEEDTMTAEQLAIKHVGKRDPKRHLEEHVDLLMTNNITQCLGSMLSTVTF